MEQSARQQWPDSDYQPLTRVPERRSSRSHMRSTNSYDAPSCYNRAPRLGKTVPFSGRSSSPLRISQSAQTTRAASRTYVPAVLPNDVLSRPRITSSRISLDIRLTAMVFVGGATIEGEISITTDGGSPGTKRRTTPVLAVGRASVSMVGIERCRSKQEIFRVLSTDIIDGAHPPPLSMAPIPIGESLWEVKGSKSLLPFRLDLPVHMGPPPYRSKKAGIRYLLCATLEGKIGSKQHSVRQTREIFVLTVHDPEKALMNLPSPLLVSDEHHSSKSTETPRVGLMAGIHRQTWISGYLAFVDVHIENNSSKSIRRASLQLERITTFHDYPAPSTEKARIDTLRLPDRMQKEIVAQVELLNDFGGIQAGARDLRTCQMELPTGLVSIDTGRYFGVRYFLNVQISYALGKHLRVQLPITILHPNSIDIPPNALAQVTASIEHKHRNLSPGNGTGSPYHYRPGQAFTAARRQSYLKLREDTIGSGEMEYLARALEGSPKKGKTTRQIGDSPTKFKGGQAMNSPSKLKVKRRQSAAVLGSLNSHSMQHAINQRASFDNGAKYRFPRSSLDTVRPVAEPPTENRVSFDDQISKGGEPSSSSGEPRNFVNAKSSSAREEATVVEREKGDQHQQHHRSSLGAMIHHGLRSRGSMETTTKGPRLQRSTSGLIFDESDKENQRPLESF